MGRHATVVQWASWPPWSLLSRHQTMARRGAAATASGCNDSLGGHVRPLPRFLSSWRDLFVGVLAIIVGLADRGEPERECRDPLSRSLYSREIDGLCDRSSFASGKPVKRV